MRFTSRFIHYFEIIYPMIFVVVRIKTKLLSNLRLYGLTNYINSIKAHVVIGGFEK